MRDEVMKAFLEGQAITLAAMKEEPGKSVLVLENFIFQAEMLRTYLMMQEHMERQTVALERIADVFDAFIVRAAGGNQ